MAGIQSTAALGLALVPLLARRGAGVEVELRGGLFQDFAPSPFHLQEVVTPLLVQMGLDVAFRVERPGCVPTGQGVLRVTVAPIEIGEDDTAAQAGAAFAVFAELTGGARLGADGAGKPGRPAERIGQRTAHQLLADLAGGATVDRHAADQLLIFTALAGGRSVYRAPAITDHVASAAWLASLFLGADTDLADDGTITVVGRPDCAANGVGGSRFR